MQADNGLYLSLAIAAALMLAGCGGSTNSASNPLPVEPPTVSVSGNVTDMPIPNATVIASVDGRSFTAPEPTSADGSYQVDIQSDDPDALVSIEAFDPNGPVRFRAIVDSFAGVAANADAMGDVTEINVTNVTTAQAVLVSRLAADGSIDSAEELEEAASRVDAGDLLELSAAIKLVVENIDGVMLPPDADDTLDLVEAIVDGTSTFITDIEASAPGALDSAVDLVLSDGNATIAFTTATAAGVYVSEDDFSIFALLPAGYGFTISDDRESVEIFDWAVNADGVLQLFIGGAEPSTQSVTLLGRTGGVVNVVVRESDNSQPGSPTTAAYFGFADGFDAQSMPGTYSTLGEPGHVTVFLDDGTGYDSDLITGEQIDSFNWSINSDGELAITDPLDGTVQYARRLAGSGDDNLRLLVWEIGADGAAADLAIIEALRSDGDINGAGTDATTLLLAGNTYALTESTELALFTFGANGTFTEISQSLEDQAWEVSEEIGTWSVDADGSISTLFPGEQTPGGASVLQGLGEDFMVVATDDGETLQVTRIVPLEAALITGSFTIVDEATGSATETVRFDADFTGVHVGTDGVADEFEWGVTASGRLLVETQGDTSFDSETIKFHMLAGSGGDVLRFVIVHRVNGVLNGVDPSTGEAPDALELLTLNRS